MLKPPESSQKISNEQELIANVLSALQADNEDFLNANLVHLRMIIHKIFNSPERAFIYKYLLSPNVNSSLKEIISKYFNESLLESFKRDEFIGDIQEDFMDYIYELARYNFLPEEQRLQCEHHLFSSWSIYAPEVISNNIQKNVPISRQIATTLAARQLYDYSFFFQYLVYEQSREVADLLQLFEYVVKSDEKNKLLKPVRAALFNQLMGALSASSDVTLYDNARDFLLIHGNSLYKGERQRLVDSCLSLPISEEDRLILLLYAIKEFPELRIQYLSIIIHLANSLNSVGSEVISLLKSQISEEHDHNYLTALIFVHDLLANKMAIPTICHLYLPMTSVSDLKSNNDYEFTSVIDHILQSLKEGSQHISQLLEGLQRHLMKLLVVYGPQLYKHLANNYLTKKSHESVFLLYSYDVEVLRLITAEIFEQFLEHDTFNVFLCTALQHANTRFLDELITRLESLPSRACAKRASILSKKVDCCNKTPLQAVIDGDRDLMAVRLYKMGARTLVLSRMQNQRSIAIFYASLTGGCIGLSHYLAVHDKLLRNEDGNLQIVIIQMIKNLSGIAIRQLPYLTDVEVSNFVLTGEPPEAAGVSQVLTDLSNLLAVRHLLNSVRKLSNSVVQSIYSTYFNNYYIIKELSRRDYSISLDNIVTILRNKSIKPVNLILLLSTLDLQQIVESPDLVSNIRENLLPTNPNLAGDFLSLIKKKLSLIPIEKTSQIRWKITLLFSSYILAGEFDNPIILALIGACYSSVDLVAELKKIDSLDEALVATICLVETAYCVFDDHYKKVLQQCLAPESNYINTIGRFTDKKIIYGLYRLLNKLWPEQLEFIAKVFSRLGITGQDLSKKAGELEEDSIDYEFTHIINADEIELYKKLIGSHVKNFQKNLLAHAIASCGNENTRILTFLLKQHELHRNCFSHEQMGALFTHMVNKDFVNNLVLAVQSFTKNSRSLSLQNSLDSLYAHALKNGRSQCADYLLPSIVSGDLLKLTAELGSCTLFDRALRANCKLQGKEELWVTYEELEVICMHNKDKLTIIALSRITNKKRWEDEHGVDRNKSRYKIKSKKPSGEQLFQTFKHQLDILNSYAQSHMTGKALNENDLEACNLALRELVNEFNICGEDNIRTHLNDKALCEQLLFFMQNLTRLLKGLSSAERLPDYLISGQLEFIASFRSKQVHTETPSSPSTSVPVVRRKDKKKGRHKRNNLPIISADSNPIVFSSGTSLYELSEPQQLKQTQTDKPVDSSKPLESTTQDMAADISKDIYVAIDEIKQLLLDINIEELDVLPDAQCITVLELLQKLHRYLNELDDCLNTSSPLQLLKEELDLLECVLTEDSKFQLTLIAKQLLTLKFEPTVKFLPSVLRPGANTPTFFKPAQLYEDVNQFCLQRLEQLKALTVTPVDQYELHHCVFRIVNALGDIYRPARLIRHFLIHEFHQMGDHLLPLAHLLLKIDLANKLSFVPIEHSMLYQLASTHPKLRQVKVQKPDFIILNSQLIRRAAQAYKERNFTLSAWLVTLLGEISAKPGVNLSIELAAQCRFIRNLVAHERYEKSLTDPGTIGNLPLVRLDPVMKSLIELCQSDVGLTATSP